MGGGVDFDTLRQLLGDAVDAGAEKYGLDWQGKRQARRLALTPSTGTLRPCPEDSVNWDTTRNLLIEGDNLEVLKLLQKSYASKVGLIYIDPPYNTGKDFIYPDNYKDSIKNYLQITGQADANDRILTSNTERSGRFHTNWLNMMYPRLCLAHTLLSDDGVIFASIDDNEMHNLRTLLALVFSEDNFVDVFPVRSNPRGNQARKLTASEHEYVLVFAKNIAHLRPLGFAADPADYKKSDARGTYREIGLRKRGAGARRNDAPNEYFPIFYNPNIQELQVDCFPESIAIFPKLSDGTDGRWRWSKETVIRKKDTLIARPVKRRNGNTEYDVFEKDYLSDSKRRKIKSMFLDSQFNYENGTEEIRDLFEGKKVMDYPKPLALLTHIIGSYHAKAGIVMDFFAGSMTVAHAVLNLNATDCGERRFITVQLPEPVANFTDAAQAGYKTIADVGKDRLRRAGNKVKQDKPEFTGDLGFRVFKLDSSNIKSWEPNLNDLEQSLFDHVDPIKEDRDEDDILYEVLLKLGFDLCVTVERRGIAGKRVSMVNDGALIACLAEEIRPAEVEGLALGIVNWHAEQDNTDNVTILFRDNAFIDDIAKTNLMEILRQHGCKDVRSL